MNGMVATREFPKEKTCDREWIPEAERGPEGVATTDLRPCLRMMDRLSSSSQNSLLLMDKQPKRPCQGGAHSYYA